MVKHLYPANWTTLQIRFLLPGDPVVKHLATQSLTTKQQLDGHEWK